MTRDRPLGTGTSSRWECDECGDHMFISDGIKTDDDRRVCDDCAEGEL